MIYESPKYVVVKALPKFLVISKICLEISQDPSSKSGSNDGANDSLYSNNTSKNYFFPTIPRNGKDKSQNLTKDV